LRYSAIELLAVLLLFFFATPFVDGLAQGDLIDALLITMVMGSAVLAVGGRRLFFVISLVLVTPALAGKWANHFWPEIFPPAIFLVAAVIFFVFVVGRILMFVLNAPTVDANVLCAGLSGYLMLGLLWVPAYVLLAQMTPGAFSFAGPGVMEGFDAFYFSFITLLCTAGYGDVMPVSKAARILVIMQSIAGIFYMTVLLARLVAMYSGRKQDTNSEKS
jgi:hypothetical protein